MRSLRRNRQRRRHWRHRASQLRRRAAKRWRCRGWKIMDFEATTTGDANTTMSPLLMTFIVVLGFTALTCCTCYNWRVVVPLSTHGLVALSLDTWILDIYGGFFIVRLGFHGTKVSWAQPGAGWPIKWWHAASCAFIIRSSL